MMDLHLLIGSAYPPGHGVLALASLVFLASFVYTAFTLGTHRHFSPGVNLAFVAVGFVLQTDFLGVRGQLRGRCPLTNLFEVIAFLCWALVLFYLIIGNTYRLSPLGMFTAPARLPAATVRGIFAGFDHSGRPERAADEVNPWLEFHAAFSVLSFGAFALAGLAGGMYLWQERQLKTHRLRSIFFQLPPIADLGRLNDAVAGRRLRAAEPGAGRGLWHGRAEHLAAPRLGGGGMGDLRFSRAGALGLRLAHRAAPGGGPVGGGVHGRAADPRRPDGLTA